jgi:hypothetical protein
VLGDDTNRRRNDVAGRTLTDRQAFIASRRREIRHLRGPGDACCCGTCRSCLDSARWDTIYKQRFADPDCYGELRIRHSSPLAGL